jgi:hypothetical protein
MISSISARENIKTEKPRQSTILMALDTLDTIIDRIRQSCWCLLEDGLHVFDELHPARLNADVSIVLHAQQVNRANDGSNRRIGGPGRGVRHVSPKNQRWLNVKVLRKDRDMKTLRQAIFK